MCIAVNFLDSIESNKYWSVGKTLFDRAPRPSIYDLVDCVDRLKRTDNSVYQ